ncbi:type IX secretion system anionic LPS delivery protein PorZ [Thermoflexibacter ruber]|uniref:Por secretion system C-terminal sorting domain-containing protein n=1 Tax=Thermoflexibacter ruber TaxID=1003 RepID=A0A1I2IHG7_9BACT|nr:two-component regulator propeller domain-containing protein [Thermoflexibacter ruber]SFF41775.1 Por secretion system C-terminal sorting domain-containing protein [Thermoflexibacter ruber]
MQKYILSLLAYLFFIQCFTCSSQPIDIPVGAWRMHLTYHNAQSIAESETSVYVASANGLFYYDKSVKSLGTLSKIEGLSDISFSQIAYHKALKILLITYQNGNIDLVKENEIVNIRSVLNSRFENKQTQHILLHENFAYLSMPFGVVVLDLQRNEVRETYSNIGANGTPNAIFASTVAKDSLFLASAQGLMAASLSPTTNRLDFRNWRFLPIPQGNLRSLSARGNSLFLGINGNDVFEYQNGTFQALNIRKGSNYTNISTSGNEVVVCLDNQISIIQANNATQTLTNAKIIHPRQAFLDANAKIWVADNALGLVTNANGTFENIYPSGTYSPESFRLLYFNDKIVCISGGYTSAYQPTNSLSGFYVFENGQWTNYNSVDRVLGSVNTPAVRDLTGVAYNSLENKLLFTSFQDGLLEWNLANNQFSVINRNNSPLISNRLAGCTVDREGNLWTTVHGVRLGEPSIYRRTRSSSWQSYTFNTFGAANPLDILTDDADNLWVRQSPNLGGGILVFDRQNRNRTLTTEPRRGGLNDINVTCFANDKQGNMWIGTESGLRVIFDASSVLDRSNVDASVVVFESRELLRGEAITALKVDGGNRKWIGTEKGVWLFSADGSQLISRFTAENSPLLSNKIIDIAIHEQTGEVFFATDRGLISYRGTATTADNSFSTVKIFPNPVPPNFSGVVSISGLANNANVKITDVSGKLVYETMANGGTAVWDGKDYKSNKSKSGVYYVFSTNADGSESFAGKFVWIE